MATKTKGKKKLIKTKDFLRKLPLNLARYPFWSCILLFILAIVFGLAVFYKTYFFILKTKPEEFQKSSVIQEQTYESVLDIWEKQEIKTIEADLKNYIDPFLGTQKIEEKGINSPQ